MKTQPPRWADRLLDWFCSPYLLEEVKGDLHELFIRDIQQVGLAKARRRYGQYVLGFVRPGRDQQAPGLRLTYPPEPNFTAMLHNFITISLRNLWRNRRITAISLGGLAVGLAGGITLFLLVTYLFGFDRYHAKADRTYWIVTDEHHDNIRPTDATPRPLGEVLRRDYPFVESAVRLDNIFRRVISIPDGKGLFLKKFEESRNLCFTEPQYFTIFDNEWLDGDPKTALATANTVVLSERYAHKYFGNASPMGRTLRFDNKVNLTVTGLIKNLPSNTKLRYDVLISYATVPGWLGEFGQRAMQSWGSISSMCFVTLRKGTTKQTLLNTFPAIEKKYLNAAEAKAFDFQAIPLGELDHDPQHGGRSPRPLLYALIIVGLALVVAACINFINLATAQALKRAKEVGVRKAVGSSRRQLIGQFLTETAILVIGAALLALLLVQLGLPALNEALSVMGADLSLLDLFQPDALIWFAGLLAGVILLAGLYPSLVLARFNPVAALRGRLTTQQVGSVNVRRGLVVMQFFITQLFIIGVLVMMSQLQYMKQADLGFTKNAVLTIPVPVTSLLQQQTLRDRLSAIPGVGRVALGSEPPAANRQNGGLMTVDLGKEKKTVEARVKTGDMNYVPVFGLTLLAGQNFQSNDSTKNEALVNETMVRQLGLHESSAILGKRLTVWGVEKTIVGVVRDFHTDGLQTAIQPTAILINYHDNHIASLAINPSQIPATMKAVEAVWNAQFPEAVYSALFTDDLLAEFYITERILLGLAQVFSMLAILIGCLGLYGLVLFMAEARTKEIGIRKVLGAQPVQLLWLFGREFCRLLLVGFMLAAPLGWLLMSGWLRGYAYRIELGWWVFALTLSGATVITVLTISYESLRAALMNPVKSLRAE